MQRGKPEVTFRVILAISIGYDHIDAKIEYGVTGIHSQKEPRLSRPEYRRKKCVQDTRAALPMGAWSRRETAPPRLWY